MSEYGKGYILKSALLEAVQWDNDVGKWVIWDDDLQALMMQKNDVVEVVRCKDCADFRPWGGQSKLGDCMIYVCDGENPFTMEETDFCSDGERREGE